MNKRLLVVLGAVLILSGCARKKEVSKKTTLDFHIWGSPEEIVQIKGWIDKFETKYPDIGIKLIHSPDWRENSLR